MIDLINKISELDKKRLNNFITTYGVSSNFIGLDKWLQQWSHSNQLLYKMLGNRLIYETDFSYEKNHNELKIQIDSLIYNENQFGNHWRKFCEYLEGGTKLCCTPKEDRVRYLEKETYYNFVKILNHAEENKIYFSAKIRKPNSSKELRLQKGMKLMRTISQILKYFSNEVEIFENIWREAYPSAKINLVQEFEEFRIKHSMILNDKFVKGRLCISIHPFDYITMSDNNSAWSSCMSWLKEGCYRVGTIEMMNANNVICCYITKSESYNFSYKQKKNEDEWLWNNKKWRQLFYIDKSIIAGGKA